LVLSSFLAATKVYTGAVRKELFRQLAGLFRLAATSPPIIISGATEGWIVAGDIAKAGVPVIIDGEVNQATAFEDLNATYENAALLAKAGVKVAFKPSFSRVNPMPLHMP